MALRIRPLSELFTAGGGGLSGSSSGRGLRIRPLDDFLSGDLTALLAAESAPAAPAAAASPAAAAGAGRDAEAIQGHVNTLRAAGIGASGDFAGDLRAALAGTEFLSGTTGRGGAAEGGGIGRWIWGKDPATDANPELQGPNTAYYLGQDSEGQPIMRDHPLFPVGSPAWEALAGLSRLDMGLATGARSPSQTSVLSALGGGGGRPAAPVRAGSAPFGDFGISTQGPAITMATPGNVANLLFGSNAPANDAGNLVSFGAQALGAPFMGASMLGTTANIGLRAAMMADAVQRNEADILRQHPFEYDLELLRVMAATANQTVTPAQLAAMNRGGARRP